MREIRDLPAGGSGSVPSGPEVGREMRPFPRLEARSLTGAVHKLPQAFGGAVSAVLVGFEDPAAVNSSFILFFPFAFLTTTFLPQEALTGWLATVANYNPVTYLLAGLRALISSGWVLADLLPAIVAVALVACVSFSLAFGALRSRVRGS